MATLIVKISVIATIIGMIAIGITVGIVYGVTSCKVEGPKDLSVTQIGNDFHIRWNGKSGNCDSGYTVNVITDKIIHSVGVSETTYIYQGVTPCTDYTVEVSVDSKMLIYTELLSDIGEVENFIIENNVARWDKVGSCQYDVQTEGVTLGTVDENVFDLVPFIDQFAECHQYEISILPKKIDKYGVKATKLFEIDIGSVKEFKVKYVDKKLVAEWSNTFPGCNYRITDTSGVSLCEESCVTRANVCRCDIETVDQPKVCESREFEVRAVSPWSGLEGQPTVEEAHVDNDADDLRFEVAYESGESVLTWEELGDRCTYVVKTKLIDNLKVTGDNGRFVIPREYVVYCRFLSDVTFCAVTDGGTEVACKTKTYIPDTTIPELDYETEPDKNYLKLNWTKLNDCKYSVNVGPFNRDNVEENELIVNDTSIKYCTKYRAEVYTRNIFPGPLKVEDVWRYPLDRVDIVENVKLINMNLSGGSVTFGWAVKGDLSSCTIDYDAKCYVTDNGPNKMLTFNKDRTRISNHVCRIDAGIKYFAFELVPRIIGDDGREIVGKIATCICEKGMETITYNCEYT